MIKQTTKSTWALIFIFLIAITAIRLVWMNFLTTFEYPQKPLAVQGVLDLRGWEFTAKQTLTLDGEWEFHPSTFIPPR